MLSDQKNHKPERELGKENSTPNLCLDSMSKSILGQDMVDVYWHLTLAEASCCLNKESEPKNSYCKQNSRRLRKNHERSVSLMPS